MLYAIQHLPAKETGQQELTTSPAQNKYPHLVLKFIDNMGHYSDEIILTQTANRQEFSFGLALLNIAEGSESAEKIDIRVECSWESWDDKVLTATPKFDTDQYRHTTPGWETTRPLIQQGDTEPYPAVLAFHGSNDNRCAYGHPLDWHRFSVTLAEKMTGKFILSYLVSSANFRVKHEGSLTIVISQAS